MSWGGSGDDGYCPPGAERRVPKLSSFFFILVSFFLFFFCGLLRCSHVKVALVLPGLMAFQASLTGVILTVVPGGVAAGCSFLYPDFGGK